MNPNSSHPYRHPAGANICVPTQFAGVDDAPLFSIDARRGYRAWEVDIVQGIVSSIAWHYSWHPGENVSTHFGRRPLIDAGKCQEELHPGVEQHTEHCPRVAPCDYPTRKPDACGFYAYWEPTLWSGPNPPHPQITGVISGYGRMVIASAGFRANRAVVLAFAMPARVADHWLEEQGITRAELNDGVRVVLAERFPGVPVFEATFDMLAAVPLSKPPEG